jgi:xanthine/CO dehydrogenase XdhC/CoxF family maturation factor
MSEPTVSLDDKALIDTLTAAGKWLARDGHVALLTVVDTWGSAPVPVGGQMAVAADGQFQGSVSGGCIEGEVITAAASVLEYDKPHGALACRAAGRLKCISNVSQANPE